MAVISAERGTALNQPSSASRSELMQAWRRFRSNRIAIAGLIFIVLLVVIAFAAPVLAPYDPLFSFEGTRGEAPSVAHPFGFDHIGRDLLSRVLYGSRVALIVGLV